MTKNNNNKFPDLWYLQCFITSLLLLSAGHDGGG